MAYVSISQNLHSDIENTLRTLHNTERASVGDMTHLNALAGSDESLRDKVDALLWEGFDDLKPRLDQFSTMSRVDLQVSYPMHEKLSVLEVAVPNMRVPCFRKIATTYSSGYHEVKVPQDFHPLVEECVRHRMSLHEIEDRWNKIGVQVKGFLNHCKSLNEALKLWPDLRKYIPSDYLTRVDAKSERSSTTKSAAAADALKAIDMDALQTSVVLARMAGAKL